MTHETPPGIVRIELWLQKIDAEYANLVSANYNRKRKSYLESLILKHLSECRGFIKPASDKSIVKSGSRIVRKSQTKRRK